MQWLDHMQQLGAPYHTLREVERNHSEVKTGRSNILIAMNTVSESIATVKTLQNFPL